MTIFDADTVLLDGLNLIEASAGTGKTYTLAELYLRLLLEQDYSVTEILVVTFTNAATQELRDRLRQKLVEGRSGLLKQLTDHKISQNLDAVKQIEQDNRILIRAIQNFDEAAIFTIHGFCQRALSDFAFESGQHFELEMIGDDQELLQSAADDFWRREVTTADKEFVSYLLAKNETPESLLKTVRNLIAKPYLEHFPVAQVDVEQSRQQAEAQFIKVKQLWQQQQQEVVATLRNTDLLNGNKYRTSSVENWLVLLEQMLEQATMPMGLFNGFDRFTTPRLQGALRQDQVLPPLDFWRACELLLEYDQQLQQARQLQHQQLRVKLLSYLQATIPQRKQQQQLLSYDDLLLNLDQALKGGHGKWLASRLRKQYPAALIDEFQDTDPVQYGIFSRIYADSGLPIFLVGDPKQSIYSFRGVDVFTYLNAKAKVKTSKTHTLTENWRSHPDLVTAINTIFSRQQRPFIYQDIPFHKVNSARKQDAVLQIKASNIAPLQLLWADTGKVATKTAMTTISAQTTANQIAQLLNCAHNGDATLIDSVSKHKSAVSGGDIAVLVRNHRQGDEMQLCLQKCGIHCVQQGWKNVFSSAEAAMLERILLAIAEPNNEARINAALATNLWGLTALEIYQLQQNSKQWAEQLNLFFELRQLWLQHGFARVFSRLLTTISAQQRLLTLPDGDRKLTNLLHLLELAQDYCSHHNDSVEAVLNWLSTRCQSADPNDETAQLRLESDEQLVKIITIHKSKGLEYPIVFCPFLWDANLRAAKELVIAFHQADDNNTAAVAFSEPELTKAQPLATKEERAEDLRLLYVALTRARERCIVVWAAVNNVENSALFSLLHPDLTQAVAADMHSDLSELAHASEGAIAIQDIVKEPPIYYQAQQDKVPTLAAKSFGGTINPPWRIGSFSALTSDHDAELPDYDTQTLASEVIVRSETLDRFGFPRGAEAGTCLHTIYEHWDFTSCDQRAMQHLVSKILLQHGFDDKKWTAIVCRWISESLVAPLNNKGLSLSTVTVKQRLDELEFYFPVANLTVKKLQQSLLPLLPDNSPLGTVLKRLRFFDLTGFMKGFIDLVFEHQGRFYVVDYKSNHLGNSEQEYQTKSLNAAMIAHDYPLQYLIYSLALHRYLKLRLPDYEPEQHLGGVYYLFIRGMMPKWDQAGVFYDKPSNILLAALDRCLQGKFDE